MGCDRRDYLALAGSASMAGIAGCSGMLDDASADIQRELLPDAFYHNLDVAADEQKRLMQEHGHDTYVDTGSLDTGFSAVSAGLDVDYVDLKTSVQTENSGTYGALAEHLIGTDTFELRRALGGAMEDMRHGAFATYATEDPDAENPGLVSGCGAGDDICYCRQ